jgi:quinol monooxygenase YgiN
MITKGLVVKLVAKAGQEEALASFLAGALPLAEAEPGTPIWLGLTNNDGKTFWVVDAFPDDAARQAHLEGPIAAALMAKAGALLEGAPEINFVDVLAAKPAG